MNAIKAFADLVCTAPRLHQADAITASRNAFVDTVGCMIAGSRKPVAQSALQASMSFGSGDAIAVGQQTRLAAPFAALTNGAAAHALDYDDYDRPANAHPSAVIFPALLAMADSTSASGIDFLDGHIVGVEIILRLGEAMNMEHYLRGWHTTMTLGSVAAAGACARMARFDRESASAALSLGASMASGLTNQTGHTAKALHAGLAAQNGVMAASLAAAGITASDNTIDGPVSLASVMGSYDAARFETALSKLGDPWAIVEHGVIAKPYPACSYTHRLVDAAIELVNRHRPDLAAIETIRISVPDFYLDLLTYRSPSNSAEAMFSAPYSVAATLVHGSFGLSSLTTECLHDAEIQRLCGCTVLDPRRAANPQLTFDPDDPDVVEIRLRDGTVLTAEVALPTGAPGKPMSAEHRRAKFDECLQQFANADGRDSLWNSLSAIESHDSLETVLSALA